jgi:hypothetical protein
VVNYNKTRQDTLQQNMARHAATKIVLEEKCVLSLFTAFVPTIFVSGQYFASCTRDAYGNVRYNCTSNVQCCFVILTKIGIRIGKKKIKTSQHQMFTKICTPATLSG